jgi:hypothetical protein
MFNFGKHSIMKRVAIFPLVSILAASVIPALTSCGEQKADSSDTTSETVTSTPETTGILDARKLISDDLPEKDYLGRSFRVLTYDQIKADVYSESANGDVINDAVFERNQKVSERFNINIEILSNAKYEETTSYIQKIIMAGDDEFDLIAHHVVAMGAIVMQDLLMNWYDIPYINFAKPWWSDSTVNDLTYGNDKAILAIGDYALSALGGTYCFFFDKPGAAAYQLGNLYDVVNEGKWTIDYVTKITKDIYKDLNNNGVKDEYDYYGLTQTKLSALTAYLWAFGNKIFEKDNKGIPVYVYKNERLNTIVEKLYGLVYESEGVWSDRPQYTDDMRHFWAALSFRDDLSLFISGTLDMTINYFRDRTAEYGILPYPKLDEKQEKYYTMADGYHAALAIPKTVIDKEYVGIITEALNAESYKIVFPAYYETALKVKYAYDAESVEMLDMIVNSRVFDFGYVYDNWKGVSFFLQRIIGTEKSKDFESYYAVNSAASIDAYNKLIKYFDSLE